MTDNPIFEILTQLESDLKSIKAAKEQVDEVLDADGEITKNLAEYSLQLLPLLLSWALCKSLSNQK